MKCKVSNCKMCGSGNIYYEASMLVKVYGTINKDGSIDEVSEHDKFPLKHKIVGYSCLDCLEDGEIE